MGTICLVEEIESESSYSSDFSSYAKSLCEDEVGNDFKVYPMLYMMKILMMSNPCFVLMFKEDPWIESLTHCLKRIRRFQI